MIRNISFKGNFDGISPIMGAPDNLKGLYTINPDRATMRVPEVINTANIVGLTDLGNGTQIKFVDGATVHCIAQPLNQVTQDLFMRNNKVQ